MIELTGYEGSILALLASVSERPEVLGKPMRERLLAALGDDARKVADILTNPGATGTPEHVAAANDLLGWAKDMKAAYT